MQAAQDLNVDHRTLAAGLESGKLSRRMRGALEESPAWRAAVPPAREQRERNDEAGGKGGKAAGTGGWDGAGR